MKNRQTKLLVNIQAMINNYNTINRLQPGKKILPVLKAGGYGIGLEAINKLIKKLNLDIVATAIVDEGITLREKLQYSNDIVVINQPAVEEIENIVEYNITTSCCYIEFLKKLDEKAKQRNKKAKISSAEGQGAKKLSYDLTH